MSNRNSIILFSCIIALIVMISISYVALPFWVYKKSKTSNIEYDKESSTITVKSNSIKVLQFTDTHINGAPDMPLTFSIIKRTIYKAKPDLVVFTGDVFSSGGNKLSVETFFLFMEKFEIPWTVVLGNHDDESALPKDQLSKRFEDANYSLYKSGNLEDLYGNYYYNIKFADNNLLQFIFMDSKNNGFTQDSLDYYESVVNEGKSINDGNVIKSFMFFHIPLPEVNDAINALKENPDLGYASIKEEPCIQRDDIPFFDKILELDSTKALIFGHDHVNRARINYKGVDFNYGTKTGTSSYNDINIGGTLYTINSNGEYSRDDLFFYK